MKILLSVFLFIIFSGIYAQDANPKAKTGWHWGASIGVYFPNKYTANYYNGSRIENNGYGLDSTNLLRVIGNHNIKKEIKEIVGGYDFEMGEYPQNMKYNPAISLVAHIRYLFNNKIGVFAQFGYQKLIASDVFTLNLDKYNNGFSSPYYYQCNIFGKEERANIDLGLIRFFPSKKNLQYIPYTLAGININDTKITEQAITIGNNKYSIVNPYNTLYNVDEGGIGYGALFGTGIHFIFNESFAFDIGADLYFAQIHINGYEAFKPNFDAHIRLLF